MTCTDWPSSAPTTLDVSATRRDVEEASERFVRQFGHYPDDVRAHPDTIWDLAMSLPFFDHPPRRKRVVLDLMGSRIHEDETVPRGVVRLALTPDPIVPAPPPPDWHPSHREIL